MVAMYLNKLIKEFDNELNLRLWNIGRIKEDFRIKEE